MGGVGALNIGARAVTMRHSASQPRDGRNIAKDDDKQHHGILPDMIRATQWHDKGHNAR